MNYLWVVPYAGQSPPMLVGRALCRAEPSMTCVGRGPMAKPPVMGPAASTRHGSETALSGPPKGGCHELLVGSALCQAEPSNIWLLARLEGAAIEEAAWGAAPHTVACNVRRPGHGAWREQPQCLWFSGARDGSTRGRGMDGQGVGDRAATPPPPWVHQPAPCRCRLLPRPRALNGEREGLAIHRPETARHTIPYHRFP